MLSSSTSTLQPVPSDSSSFTQDHLEDSFTVPDATMDFPPDKIHLFERRFENGYNVYTDREYVAWLQAAHPESEFSVAALFSCISPMTENSGSGAVGE